MRNFERYCDDIENVENYEQAKADDFKGWHCHHRLELVATGGVCDVTAQDLIDWCIYYHRPASELIFLREVEHTQLHHKGKKMSKESRKKISESGKGRYCSEETKRKISEALKGKKHSDEAIRKMSEAKKGKHPSEEARKRMSEAHKGKRPWNYGMKVKHY